jgi:hypothetical protein
VQTNPYQPPSAPIPQEGRVEDVALGQKLVIYGILINLCAIGLQVVIGPVAGLIGLATIVLSIMGILRLSTGMGWGTGSKVGLIVLMFMPLVNLITLVVVNSRATALLRNNGYKVGLLGASK